MTSDTDFPHDISAAREAYLKAQRKDRKRKADKDRAAGKRRATGKGARPKVPPPPAMLQPRTWPDDLKAQWIQRLLHTIMDGGSVTGFCRDHPEGPQKAVWYQWLRGDAIFADEYTQAREISADTLADDCVAIADEVKDAGQMDSARVNAARLRVDARKWVASKLKPKVYADRIETVTSGHLTVSHSITDEDRAKALASIMAREAVKTAPNLLVAQRMIEGTAIDVTPETAPQTKPA